MNPMALLQLKDAWEKFQQRHPKLTLFFQAVSDNGLQEGTVIEIQVKAPDGKTYSSNLKMNKEDLELVRELQNLK